MNLRRHNVQSAQSVIFSNKWNEKGVRVTYKWGGLVLKKGSFIRIACMFSQYPLPFDVRVGVSDCIIKENESGEDMFADCIGSRWCEGDSRVEKLANESVALIMGCYQHLHFYLRREDTGDIVTSKSFKEGTCISFTFIIATDVQKQEVIYNDTNTNVGRNSDDERWCE